MGKRCSNIEGRKFGRLTPRVLLKERANRSAVWLCDCDCGGTCKMGLDKLRDDELPSCGCLDREMDQALAAAVRKMRKETGWSLLDVAWRIGISQKRAVRLLRKYPEQPKEELPPCPENPPTLPDKNSAS